MMMDDDDDDLSDPTILQSMCDGWEPRTSSLPLKISLPGNSSGEFCAGEACCVQLRLCEFDFVNRESKY